MESSGGSLRVLSRPSPASAAPTQSSASSSVALSSSSAPFNPTASSGFNFPAPPGNHNISPPSYPPPPPPPLLINPSTSARSFPPSNTSGKITILTSSAPSSTSSIPIPSAPSDLSSTGTGALSADANPVDHPTNGVVVVGAVGRSETDVSQLLNRLLDAQVFGYENGGCRSPFEDMHDVDALLELKSKAVDQFDNSNSAAHNRGHSAIDRIAQEHSYSSEGKGAKKVERESLYSCSSKGLKRLEWMKRRLKFYHDEEKGAVYVHFAWGPSNTQEVRTGGLDMSLHDSEESILRGLLYMFSVCHIILLIQEGARVDTHLLRNLRVLQNAKHFFTPFVKTQVFPGLHLATPVLDRTSIRSSHLSSSHSPGRGGTGGRNASTIGLMSGSAPSFIPGQCTPVLLFVFLEDFTDPSMSILPAVSTIDDKIDSQSMPISQPGAAAVTSRQPVHLKSPNAVVMLARVNNKTEGGLRKKLQSSLEAQIRYLVKKCKVLCGFGDGFAGGGMGLGPRGPGNSMSSAAGVPTGSSLFVLDTMRVACLLDKGANLRGDALKGAMNVMNDIIRGKENSTNALTDLTHTATEDIQAIRDFVWKQAEILRGRGVVLSNSTAGSMGVGMVAAAAAAAAASAAAGSFGVSGGALKPVGNPPELPSMSIWLSACQILVDALIRGEGHPLKEAKKVLPVRVAGSSRKGSIESGNVSSNPKDALGVTLHTLEITTDLDMKFSTEWCKRMFPSALAIYTKGLPPCYPTLVHQSHLEKALRMFKRMVRGPAVTTYTNKLQGECEAIWRSGRQLCDATSLTGKPCIHKVHDTLQGGADGMSEAQSSVCKDNEKPGEPEDRHAKPHSSGVVFLHACACGRSRRIREDPFDIQSANTTFYQFPNCEDLLPSLVIPDCEDNQPLGGLAWSLVRLGGAKYYQQSTGLLQSGFSHNKKFLSPWIMSYILESSVHNNGSLDARKSSPQELLPRASRSFVGALSFLDVLEQGNIHTHSGINVLASLQGKAASDVKKSKMIERSSPAERKQAPIAGTNVVWDEKRLFADVVATNTFDFPPLQQRQMQSKIGKSTEKKEALQQAGQVEGFAGRENNFHYKEREDKVRMLSSSGDPPVAETVQEGGTLGIKNALVFLGFEHECPRGHRFLLSSEEVEALGSIGPSRENFLTSHQKLKDADDTLQMPKLNNKIFNGMGQGVMTKNFSTVVKEPLADTALYSKAHYGMPCKIVNGGSGEGYALLNKNLPIYMKCPHCSKLSEKKKKNSPSFAGNISQLQRIFLVTPPLPLLISACPVVQFDEVCARQIEPYGGVCRDRFSIGSSVVLPPESFVVLRLPFVYYLELDNGSKYPLKCDANRPESTASLLKGSTFRIISSSESGTV